VTVDAQFLTVRVTVDAQFLTVRVTVDAQFLTVTCRLKGKRRAHRAERKNIVINGFIGFIINPAIKQVYSVMPVPDQVLDDGSGFQCPPGFRLSPE
jgi:hypothetical protein